MIRRGWCLWIGLCCLFGAIRTARASDNTAVAVAAFDEAEALMKQQKYHAACAKYRESHTHDPQLGTLLHLADCLEKDGRIASAWGYWREAEELAEQRGDARLTIAKQHAADLEGKLPRLQVRIDGASQVDGLHVERGGIPLGPGLWGSAVPVDPGEHTLRAVAPGREPWQKKVIANLGQTVTVDVPVLAPMPEGAPAAEAGTVSTDLVTADQETGTGTVRRVIGYSVAGLGAVGLGLGAFFVAKRNSTVSERDAICAGNELDCPLPGIARNNELTTDARRYGRIGVAGLGAGGALLVTGLIVALTVPSATDDPGVAIAASLGPGFFGAQARATW